jgi:hypothetical protein
MKVKVINRSAEENTKERSQDVQKVHKNLDATLHPFERAVEYTRALNAAKLDRSESCLGSLCISTMPFVFPGSASWFCFLRYTM